MLTPETVTQTPLFQQLRDIHERRQTSDPLERMRVKAWERFLQLGLPLRHIEVYRYVRQLRHLYAGSYTAPAPITLKRSDISAHLLPECAQSTIVLVNGHFDPSLSNLAGLDPKVVVTDLTKAIGSYGAFLNNSWTVALKEETDAFAIVNAALHVNGLFLYVPTKCQVATPIHILHVVHGQNILLLPRTQIAVGKEAAATILSSTVELTSSGYAVNQVCDLTLEDNAQVHFVQACHSLAADAWHLDAFRAKLKRDSHLRVICYTDGARTTRHDYRVTLTGEGADASLNGLWMLDEKREAHTNVLIEHQAPHCRSHQLFKGVLADTSRSSFEGKILVQRVAQKTEAYQLNNNLLLDDKANAESKPNLEVFADDVKASHGATVGQLDQEELFYLKTRGLEDSVAKNLLVAGYGREVIDQIPVQSLQQQLNAQIQTFRA